MIIYGEHILVFFTVLSPVWASIIWHIKMKHTVYYWIFGLLTFVVTTFLAWNPVVIPHVTFWMHYYGLFLLVGLFSFGLFYKFTDFNKALALTVFVLFIAGDLWELPQFIYDFTFNHNGIVDWIWTISHIRRVYTLASFLLLVKLAKIKLDRYSLFLALLAMIPSIVLLLPSVTMFPEQGTIIRIIWLATFTLIVWLGLKNGRVALVDAES